LFVVLSPVFAMQYLLLPLPFLAVLSPRLGYLFSSIAGLLLADIYFNFESVIRTSHPTPIANFFSLSAWGLCVCLAYRMMKKRLHGPSYSI
jgi:hypothetical protein